MDLLQASLPKIYHSLLPPQVLELGVSESLATCHDCPQLLPKAKPAYAPELKCCTFFPLMGNYLVGGILAEDLPGKEALIKMMKWRQFVLPVGLGPAPAYQWRFVNKDPKDFGNRPELLCPFYEKEMGGCRVWQFRSSECRSFFCRSEAGEKGELFWRSFNELLFFTEVNLSQSFLFETGYLPADFKTQIKLLRRMEFKDGDGQNWCLSEYEHQKIWDHWLGREEEFFLKAYEWVKGINYGYWLREYGEPARKLTQDVVNAHRQTKWGRAKTRKGSGLKPLGI